MHSRSFEAAECLYNCRGRQAPVQLSFSQIFFYTSAIVELAFARRLPGMEDASTNAVSAVRGPQERPPDAGRKRPAKRRRRAKLDPYAKIQRDKARRKRRAYVPRTRAKVAVAVSQVRPFSPSSV